MSYNSARDELFLADFDNRVVRAMRLCDSPSDLCDVYKSRDVSVWSVCHMGDSDILLVSIQEQYKRWLVALSRIGSEWCEEQRIQTEKSGWISCALVDSRVLVGERNSKYMELFQLKSGQRIERLHSIEIKKRYHYFSATCCSDTLVAMSYEEKNEVRVHRLCGHRLEELARTRLKSPYHLQWFAYRLIATEWHDDIKSNSVVELELSGSRLIRRRQLISPDEKVNVYRWCAVDDGLAILDYNSKDIVHYKFGS